MTADRPLAAYSRTFVVLLAAALPSRNSADELIRRANAAFARDDLDEADGFYEAAEVRDRRPRPRRVQSGDGTVPQAENVHARPRDSTSLALERRARARRIAPRGRGTTAAPRYCDSRRDDDVYRSAIACLERCLDSTRPTRRSRPTPRTTSELAKLLWNEARKKEKKDDNPNDDLPPEDPRSEPPNSRSGTETAGPATPIKATAMPECRSPRSCQQPTAARDESGAAHGSGAGAGRDRTNPAARGQRRTFNRATPEETREELAEPPNASERTSKSCG